MPEERKLKGINFTGTLGAFTRAHGDEARAAVEAKLPGELGETVRQRMLLASSWYPASWYAKLLDVIVEEVDGNDDTARAVARDAVSADFRTLFKIVRLFMTPQKAAQQAIRVSGRYIDGGVVEVVDANDGMVHFRFREYYGYTRLMWRDFIGGIEGVLESMGAQGTTARIVAGGGDGEDHLEVVLRWRT